MKSARAARVEGREVSTKVRVVKGMVGDGIEGKWFGSVAAATSRMAARSET
jgi:hypothetical protein